MGAVPTPPPWRFPVCSEGPTASHLITTAAALRLGDAVHLRFRHRPLHLGLGFGLGSLFKGFSHFSHLPRLKNVWDEIGFLFKGFEFLESSCSASSSASSSCLCFLSKKGEVEEFGDEERSYLKSSSGRSYNRRLWTNILIGVNILAYLAQIATNGKLMLWGAKINSLIDQGQFWRFATSSFLHANIGHLMVNCYSLNSIGPTIENISGPRRFLAVYFTSAIASSAMSYWFCKAPSVGASGAIFGLVGSFAVFVLRHKSLVGGGKQDLQHVAHVIALNMIIGLMSKGIDNWGHLGGLLGGALTSWLVGPAWKYESRTKDGRAVFLDRAPIFYLADRKGKVG
ncbi:hypothetical protein Scep_019032 [Stephania cephalantha]|uniref:Peptidase S54 rhomboid domain-containing protein n=1 Tax=Stephania cephalantha TaxID=152367 RepID=A0AAP0IAG5_9MAGN